MTRLTRNACLILCLCSFAAHASEDTGQSEYKDISVTDLFAGQFKSVDILVPVPGEFVVMPLKGTFGRYVCAPSNIADQVSKKSTGAFPDPGGSGYFAATLSMVYGYDRDKKIFTDFRRNTEKTLAAGLQADGAKHVNVRRADTNGHPVLLLDIVMPDGTHFCNVFIALKVETNVLSIRYFPSKKWSARDSARWKSFMAAFAKTGDKKEKKSNN